jgi:hypothetical protein
MLQNAEMVAAAALPKTISDQDYTLRQSSKDPLTSEEYENCLLDQTLADTDMNSKLTMSEYLLFLSINAARYGYEWPYDKVTFQDSLEVNDPDVHFANLPLEFPMLFHSTACLCAYTQGVDSKCCTGDNEHVAIYNNTANIFDDELTSEQMAYTTAFCAEALYTYSKVGLVAVPIPTSSPSIAPVVTTTMPTLLVTTTMPTLLVTTTMPTLLVTTTMPTIIPTIEVTTLNPTEVKETDSPTESPTVQITTLLPTEEPTAVGEPTASPTIQLTTLLPTEVEETSEPTTDPTVEVVETERPTEVEFPTVSPTVEEATDTGTPTESPTEEATADTNSPTKLEFPTMAPTGPKEETNAPSASRGITMSPTVLAETGSPTQSPTVSLTTSRPSIAVTELTTAGPLSIELQYDYNSECGVTADDIINGLNDITLKDGLALATETIVIGVLNSTYPAGGSTLAPIGKSTPAPAPSPVTAASGSTYRPTTNLEIPVTDDVTLIPSSSLEGSGGGESSLAPDAGTSDSETGTTLAPTVTVISPALRSYTVMEASPRERVVEPYHLFPNNKNIHHRGLSNLRLGLRHQWLRSSNSDERRQQSVTNAPTPTGLDIVTNVPTVAGSGGSDAVPTTDDSSTTLPTMGSSATVGEESSSSSTAIDGDSTTAPTMLSTPPVGSGLSLAPTPFTPTATITDVTGTILVYYTSEDPVIITAAEEYIDGCPLGFTCSKITSTVPLTLVSGNPEDVEVTVTDGFEASIDDESFFDAIPSDTVQCPEDASVVTIAPSPAPFALLDPSGIVAPAVTSSYSPTIEVGSMSMSMSGVTLTPSGIESTETQSPTAAVGSSGTGTLAPSIGGTAVATTTPPVVATARGIEIYSPTILTRTDDTDWTQNLENLHEKY